MKTITLERRFFVIAGGESEFDYICERGLGLERDLDRTEITLVVEAVVR